MAYGTLKCDNIVFDNGGTDKLVTVSGLFFSTSGALTVTGTISGGNVVAPTATFTTLTGTTTTGTTATFTSGSFTTLTGTTVTGTTANFVSGVFTTQISGATITGTTVATTTGSFVSLTGTTATFTSGIIASGTAALPSLAILSDPNTGIYSPGADQLAISTNGTQRLSVNANGTLSSTSAVAATASFTGPANAYIDFTDGTGIFRTQLSSNTPVIGAASNHGLIFNTNNTERLRINPAGLVGIGTSSPGNPLTVFRGAGTSAYIESVGNANTANPMLIGQDSAGVARIWQSGNNALGFWTNSLQRLTINGSGNVGIGTTSPDALLTVNGIGAFGAGAVTTPSISATGDLNTGFWFPAADTIAASTGGSERARIDSSGRLLVGTSTSRGEAVGVTPAFQLESTSFNAASSSFTANVNSIYGPFVDIVKTRGASNGSKTIVQSGDYLGSIRFLGADGSSYIRGALVEAYVDGTPGTDDMPCRLVFSTTANGAATSTERLRITSAGLVGIGTTGPATTLDVNGDVTITDKIIHGGDTNTAIRFPAADTVSVETAGSERARIDSSGRLLVGTSTAIGNCRIESLSTDNNHLALIGGNQIAQTSFFRSSSSTGAAGLVADGNVIARIECLGNDGSAYRAAARIEAVVDGTPAASDMPGRLVFLTTADGASSPTERLRITSAGVLQVADAGNITVGTTTGTKIGTATTQKLGFYNATPVVQPTAVADATTAVDVITQLNDLLAKLRTLGIIAT